MNQVIVEKLVDLHKLVSDELKLSIDADTSRELSSMEYNLWQIYESLDRAALVEDIDQFAKAYLEAALWSSSTEDGDSLDDLYTVEDFSESALAQAQSDCDKFVEENALLLKDLDKGQAGHDFWLSRNGYGAGFFDRDTGEVGNQLQLAAREYRQIDVFVGNDGKLYLA